MGDIIYDPAKYKEEEKRENEFYKNSQIESPYNFSIYNIANKAGDIKVFLEELDPYKEVISKAERVLEIGGGQGWASCILKKMYNDKQIICSDLSEWALESLKYWEEMFKVRINKSMVCKSYEIPLDNASVDLVFCFQAAHHFREYYGTLSEIHRILKPDGYRLLLHEPSCRRYIHKLAYKRVTRIRPDLPEDVLIYKDILCMAEEIGFQEYKIMFRPILTNRKPIPMIYYCILGKIKFLSQLLPSMGDYLFRK
ncbi:MAG: class I SAM-dependent methyltransferase [Treponema sp.]|jgi:SAM-dependent methyltransferase|nr:class I SAM-dependent methyltransferase [Treponema sp.]